MIPLPKLIWPYKDEECQLLSLAEIKDLQREAMRVALEAAAKVCPAFEAYTGPDAWLRGHDHACMEAADRIRNLKIEGEQP